MVGSRVDATGATVAPLLRNIGKQKAYRVRVGVFANHHNSRARPGFEDFGQNVYILGRSNKRLMNNNECLNCGEKIRKSKRRDAVYCDHECRMMQSNMRNERIRFVIKQLKDKPLPSKAVWKEKAIKGTWIQWPGPENVYPKKPELDSDAILKILEELHR